MNAPAESTAAVLTRTLSSGTVVDLSQPWENGMPCSPSHPGFRFALLRRHGDGTNAHGMSGATELIVTGGHVGTHVDALCHVGQDGKLFGGVDALEASRGGRFSVHGVDTLAPFLCRSVLADIPRAQGKTRLDAGYAISADDIATALCGTPVHPGDAVLVRTGWPQLYTDPVAYVGHATGVPGLGPDAAEYLASLEVRAVGCDTIAADRIAPGQGHSYLPAHEVLLVRHGIPLLEVLDLEHLAQLGPHDFIFVAVPLKITGGTGSPIRPLAVLFDG
ncbi:cyclase family protein [Amycolatopsis pithecellobii]|uniref:Cyclase family protein n=1 Tax=Amycolatopsis pithecellobii TaxID=664692 RepID=A0A6N7YZQ5_9PSEU|nr:cyclase family protein [Amycolatopsis pithecellobii]MTD52730.1 cyclase family protein [Amycolatopsis pithecellobii]